MKWESTFQSVGAQVKNGGSLHLVLNQPKAMDAKIPRRQKETERRISWSLKHIQVLQVSEH